MKLTTGSMTSRRHHMHRTETVNEWNQLPVSHTVNQPQVYDVIFQRLTNQCSCSFHGCPGYSCTWNGLLSNLKMQHWGGWIRILEKHPNPIPRCKRCRSQVSVERLSNHHYMSDKCNKGEKRRLRRKTLQQCFEESRVLFQINSKTLPLLEAFPYLSRTIATNSRDWLAV